MKKYRKVTVGAIALFILALLIGNAINPDSTLPGHDTIEGGSPGTKMSGTKVFKKVKGDVTIKIPSYPKMLHPGALQIHLYDKDILGYDFIGTKMLYLNDTNGSDEGVSVTVNTDDFDLDGEIELYAKYAWDFYTWDNRDLNVYFLGGS